VDRSIFMLLSLSFATRVHSMQDFATCVDAEHSSEDVLPTKSVSLLQSDFSDFRSHLRQTKSEALETESDHSEHTAPGHVQPPGETSAATKPPAAAATKSPAVAAAKPPAVSSSLQKPPVAAATKPPAASSSLQKPPAAAATKPLDDPIQYNHALPDHGSPRVPGGVQLPGEDSGTTDPVFTPTGHGEPPGQESAATEPAFSDHAAPGEESNPHKHPSIFKLHFAQLDREVFWWVLIAMLAFTIVVDRMEYYATLASEHDMTKQMYLARLNAELMMFGLVSTCVFVTEQFFEPSVEDVILFEFVDIFCSAGACGLFITGLVLFILHHTMERQWKVFGGRENQSHSMREEHRTQAARDASSSLLAQALHADYLDQVDVKHCEFCIMSARFKRAHALPDGFDYPEYLKLSLTDSICDLMNINWVSWLMVLGFAIFLYVFHYMHGHYTVGGYFVVFAVGVAVLFLVHILVYVAVLQGNKYLSEGLGCDSLKTLQEQLREAVENPELLSVEPVQRLNNKLVYLLEQTIQLVGLATSFQGAFFCMHILYNVPSTVWRLVLFTPIVLNSTVLLPLIISHFTVLKAYCSPDHAILDMTLEWSTKLEEDFNFLSKQLKTEKVSLEKFRSELNGNSQTTFLKSMVDMGIHCSSKRAYRMYKALADERGQVDPNAVIDALPQS